MESSGCSLLPNETCSLFCVRVVEGFGAFLEHCREKEKTWSKNEPTIFNNQVIERIILPQHGQFYHKQGNTLIMQPMVLTQCWGIKLFISEAGDSQTNVYRYKLIVSAWAGPDWPPDSEVLLHQVHQVATIASNLFRQTQQKMGMNAFYQLFELLNEQNLLDQVTYALQRAALN